MDEHIFSLAYFQNNLLSLQKEYIIRNISLMIYYLENLT